MKKIQFFARELGFTGLTKEIITLVNALSELYNIEIVFINDSSTTPYILNKKVAVKYINNSRISCLINDKIKKVINDYQANIIISTDYHFNKTIAKYNKKASLIYWNHSIDLTKKEIKRIVLTIKKYSKIVFASHSLANIFKEYTSIECLYIADGIQSEKEKISDLRSKNLVFIGKLNSNKCINDLLDVMSMIRKEDKEVVLSIVGDGEERNNLVNKAKTLRLGLSVSFLGELSEDEKRDVLLDSAIFITASKSNSFGISILEAMSAGLPVVAFSESINNNEIIRNDINGYIVSNRDKVEMKNKIMEILNNDELRNTMGSCAKETSAVYDINNIKSEWIKILK